MAKATFVFPVLLGLGLPILIFGRFYVGLFLAIAGFLVLLPITFVVGLLTTKERFAGEDVPDPPKVEVTKAPRPEITPFRGSKIPPPMYNKPREPDVPPAKLDD